VDERVGQRKLVIEDTTTGDAIVWDLEKQGLRIKMTAVVIVDCDGLVKVDGAQVTLQERLVRVTGKPV
jgi:phage gp45-like